MVYLHFPSNLTDEELMLQAKYQKLRKKKKALQDMKAPKPEPEKINPLKRPLDPKDAKELAKKLIQSGKVSLPTKPTVEKTTFKRSRILERKITATGRSEGHGGMTPSYNSNFNSEAIQFEPFTPQYENGRNEPRSDTEKDSRVDNEYSYSKSRPGSTYSHNGTPGRNGSNPRSNFSGGSYRNNFSSGAKDGFGDSSSNNAQSNKPKRGPTLFVQGQNINEDILKNLFGKFGKIANVKITLVNSKAFVTFEKVESAEEAIKEVNGNTIDDIYYDVQFARRQPSIGALSGDSSASAAWPALAVSQSHKGTHHDRRQQVVYDEPMDII